MMTIEWTSILVAVITAVSGWVTYWFDRRRHKQEVESLKADNRQKDMNLSKDYGNNLFQFIDINPVFIEFIYNFFIFWIF